MENISEVLSKKKTKRNRKGLMKTKRNYKKKNILTNSNVNNIEIEVEKKEEDKGGFLENLFSWF